MAFRIKEVDMKKNETYVYADVHYDLDVLFDLIKVYQKVDRMNPSRDVTYIIFDDSDGRVCFKSR